MEPKDFLLEEYKQLHAQVNTFQDSYTRLERLTFGGVMVAYGFSLTNIDKVPKEAWFAIPILICISAVRCFSYYFTINKKHALYIGQFESELYDGKFIGFQNFHTRQWPVRNTNLIFNAVGWTTLIGASILAAYWRFFIYSSTSAPTSCLH